MANLAQMLAASQAMLNPSIEARKVELGKEKTNIEVGKAKRRQAAKLQAEMEAAIRKATKRRKRGFGRFFSGLGKLLSFIPGVGTAVGAGISGLGSALQAKQQRMGLRELRKSGAFDKYKKSWLGSPSKQFMQSVRTQEKDIDPFSAFTNTFGAGLIGGGIAKGLSKGLQKGLFKGPPQGVTKDILELGAWDESGELLKNITLGKYDKGGPFKNLAENLADSLGMDKEALETLITNENVKLDDLIEAAGTTAKDITKIGALDKYLKEEEGEEFTDYPSMPYGNRYR